MNTETISPLSKAFTKWIKNQKYEVLNKGSIEVISQFKLIQGIELTDSEFSELRGIFFNCHIPTIKIK